MKIRQIVLFAVFISALFLLTSAAMASESEHCQPDRSLAGNCKLFSEKESGAIKTSNDPNLIMGTSIINLASNPTSSIGRDLLELASRIESPKAVATTTLFNYNLDPSRSFPLEPFKETIAKLLQNDRDNSLSYYLNAILLQEKSSNQQALNQIMKGNTYKYNGYTKQRFYAIAKAAEMNKCGVRQARELAFWNSNNAAIYLKLRRVCRDLEKEFGQEAQDACMVMGKNLEASSLTCLESLFSLAMQSESLNQTTADDATREEIKKRREVAFACGARTTEIPEIDMTDEVDKQYYEIYLDKGEASAQHFLQRVSIKK